MAKLALAYWYIDSELAVIDTETGAVDLVRGVRGRVPAQTFIIHPDGYLYFGTRDPGMFYSYKDGVLRNVGSCGDYHYYSSYLAADGKIYLGTYPKGTLEVYDPSEDTLTRIGEFDPSITGSQYVHTLVSDGVYAYAGMGQAPWYLAIIHIATGETAYLFKENGLNGAEVHSSLDGSRFFYAGYELVAGEAILPDGPIPTLRTFQKPNNVQTSMAKFATEGWEFDFDNAGGVTGAPAVVRYRAAGEDTWQSIEIGGLTLIPAIIKRVVSLGDKLLGIPYAYGPVFLYNPATKETEVVGWTQSSLYDALVSGTDVYLSGYTSVTFRWDTTQPWTLTLSSTDRTVTNPRLIASWHRYHYFQCIGADGLLYVGVNHARDSTGAELGWYNPIDGSVGSLRDPVATYDPEGITAAGQYVVLSATNDAAGRLFVYDTVSQELVNEVALPADMAAAGPIAGVDATQVIGVIEMTAYRVDVLTGQVVWRVTLPDTAFRGIAVSDRRLVTASDGYIWFSCGTGIYKMNPANGELYNIASLDVALSVCFCGDRPYLYGDTLIRRVIL